MKDYEREIAALEGQLAELKKEKAVDTLEKVIRALDD